MPHQLINRMIFRIFRGMIFKKNSNKRFRMGNCHNSNIYQRKIKIIIKNNSRNSNRLKINYSYSSSTSKCNI